MTTRNRVAHTASLLQTFHTAQTTAARREAAGAEGSEPFAAPADAEALAFVKGQSVVFAQPTRDGSYTVEIEGHPVKLGAANLTEKQAAFIISLLTDRDVHPELRASTFVRLEQGLAKFAASTIIDGLKAIPFKPREAKSATADSVATPEVPAGRYAIATEDGVKFYRLDRPTEGKWAGYTFLKVQASDDLYPIRNRTEKDRIIAEIAKDVNGSATAYGQLLGKCYACGRTLTDETSRALGIGPDCRSK